MLNWIWEHQLAVFGMVALVVVAGLVSGCKSAAYHTHPGSVDAFDSQSYDALLVAQATIQQAKTEVQAGALPASATGPLNHAIQAYDVAETAWQAYHAAGKNPSGVASQEKIAAMEAMTVLASALAELQKIGAAPASVVPINAGPVHGGGK